MHLQELSAHNNHHDCWTAIDGSVYDITEYIDEHPGGKHIILTAGGVDATILFHTNHYKGKSHMHALANKCKLKGRLVESEPCQQIPPDYMVLKKAVCDHINTNHIPLKPICTKIMASFVFTLAVTVHLGIVYHPAFLFLFGFIDLDQWVHCVGHNQIFESSHISFWYTRIMYRFNLLSVTYTQPEQTFMFSKWPLTPHHTELSNSQSHIFHLFRQLAVAVGVIDPAGMPGWHVGMHHVCANDPSWDVDAYELSYLTSGLRWERFRTKHIAAASTCSYVAFLILSMSWLAFFKTACLLWPFEVPFLALFIRGKGMRRQSSWTELCIDTFICCLRVTFTIRCFFAPTFLVWIVLGVFFSTTSFFAAANHYMCPEDMNVKIGSFRHNFLKDILKCTYNVKLPLWLTFMGCGPGPAFHILHHLFPSMNWYTSTKIEHVVKKMLKENGYPYKSLTAHEYLKMRVKLFAAK